mgnify:CR=1 FL=1
MDILKYIIFAILPIIMGAILSIFIDYYDKISGRKLCKINYLKYLIIRSKNRNNQNQIDNVSFSAAIMQVIHYTLIVIYFITGYLIYNLDGQPFNLYLAYGICIYGIFLLGAVVFIYIRTIIKESKK